MKLADILDSNTAAGNLFYSEGFTYALDGYVEYSTNPETLGDRKLILNDRIIKGIIHREDCDQYEIYYLDCGPCEVTHVCYDLTVKVIRPRLEATI